MQRGVRVQPSGNPMQIEDVYASGFRRAKRSAPLIVQALFLILWGPFGILLVALRASLLALAAVILLRLPVGIKRSISRPVGAFIFRFIFGWIPSVSNRRHLAGARLITLNHIGNLDAIFAYLFLCRTTAVVHRMYAGIWVLLQRLGLLGRCIYTSDFNPAEAQRMRDEITATVKGDATQHAPLLLCPEGTVNRGDVALLRYERFVFELGVPVTPCALRVSHPWPFVHWRIGASAVDNVLWMLFLPCVVIRFHVLPPMSRSANESSAAFASRVQQLTATRLGVHVCDHSWVERDAFLQAIGMQRYNPKLWLKARTTVGEKRDELLARLEASPGAPNRALLTRLLQQCKAKREGEGGNGMQGGGGGTPAAAAQELKQEL